jgi:large subunit ribosomal protein L18
VLKDRSKVKRARKERLRKRIAERVEDGRAPRVHVFRATIHLQVIDTANAVLAAASTLEKEFKDRSRNTKNKAAAEVLGELLAGRLKAKKIDRIVFDRGTYLYHGRIKVLADAMR